MDSYYDSVFFALEPILKEIFAKKQGDTGYFELAEWKRKDIP